MPPVAATTKGATSSANAKTIARVKASSSAQRATLGKQSSADGTKDLEAKLSRMNLDSKRKEKAKEVVGQKSSEEVRLERMRAVNTASQKLSGFISSAKGKGREKVILDTAKEAIDGLEWLRANSMEASLDVERASVSVLGKLVALGQHSLALEACSDIHPSLCKLNRVESSRDGILGLLVVPMPSRKLSDNSVLDNITASYLLNALAVVAEMTLHPARKSALTKTGPDKGASKPPSCQEFAELMVSSEPTLIQWATRSPDLKQISNTLTRAYGILMQATNSASSSKSEPLPEAEAIFLLRLHALCLLLRLPSSEESKEEDVHGKIWSQAVKYGSQYSSSSSAKGCIGSKSEDGLRMRTVSRGFTLLASFSSRKSSLTGDEGWSKFVDCWAGAARKAGDREALDLIASNLSASESSQTPSEEAPSPEGESENLAKIQKKQSSKLCAQFALAETLLSSTEEDRGKLQDVCHCLRKESLDKRSIIVVSPNEDSDIHRKAFRSFECLRRTAIKCLKSSRSQEAYEIVTGCVAVLEARVALCISDKTVSAILDSCFALSRASVDVKNVTSWSTSWSHFDKAAKLLGLSLEQSSRSLDSARTMDIDFANYAMVLSANLHNVAGTLYNAGQYAGCIRFLKGGCHSGLTALNWRKFRDVEEADEGAWKQLKCQLWKRWDLLGACHGKIGDRREAFNAYRESIICCPQPSRGEEDENKLNEIIERQTLLGSELRLSAEELSLCSSDAQPCCDKRRGQLMLYQIASLLTPSRRSKSSTRSYLPSLLKDALHCYTEAHHPIRRAMVYLLFSEWSYYSREKDSFACNEVSHLLSSDDLGQDSDLIGQIGELKAISCLWCILLTHKYSNISQNVSDQISKNAESALHALSTVLSALERSYDTGNKGGHSPKAKKDTTGGKKTNASKPVAARHPTVPANPPGAPRKARPKTKVVVSPPRKASRNALQNISLNSPPSKALKAEKRRSLVGTKATWKDASKVVNLCRMASFVLDLFGLIPLKIQLIEVVLRITELTWGSSSSAHIQASVDLAHAYTNLDQLGRAKSIFTSVQAVVSSGSVDEQTSVVYWLRLASNVIYANENIHGSSTFYSEALKMFKYVPKEDKSMTSLERILVRAERLTTSALASKVFASIQFVREDAAVSLSSLHQSFRLLSRAGESLGRLQPAPSQTTLKDPFSMADLQEALPSENPAQAPAADDLIPKKKATGPRVLTTNLDWKIAVELFDVLIALSDAYLMRGSPREAEFFAQEAVDFSEALNAPAFLCRALSRKSEILLLIGKVYESRECIVKLSYMIEIEDGIASVPGAHTAEVKLLEGRFYALSNEIDLARQSFTAALEILSNLSSSFKAVSKPSKNNDKSQPKDEVPNQGLQIAILKELIWLLRDADEAEVVALLNRFLSLSSNPRTKAEENVLMARLTLHNVHSLFKNDMFLNSVAESTISLPPGMKTDFPLIPSTSIQDITTTLENAENLFWTTLSYTFRRGSSSQTKNTAMSLASIQGLKTSLGFGDASVSLITSGLLDLSTSITLKREMLEAIRNKFLAFTDDIQWPLITPNGTPLPVSSHKKTPQYSANESIDSIDIDDDEDDEQYLRSYWESLRQKYQSQVLDLSAVSRNRTALLPSNWSVVCLGVSDDKSTLFVSRQRGGESEHPLIFCIPLRGRREGNDEDEPLTFDDALGELKDIVRLSDETTKTASAIKKDDQEARASWWRQRADLDTRMRALLENIEFCWLGAFKTLLNPRSNRSPDTIKDLRERFERVFHLNLQLKDKKPKNKAGGHVRNGSMSQNITHVKLSEALIECFGTLSPTCRDEELEDLVYFVLDLYQYHGVPVAVSEVDIDRVVVDLRAVLESQANTNVQGRARPPRKSHSAIDPEEHTFLVLDKNVQGFPWESIPVLRGRSVSRIPNLDFLLDRIEMSRQSTKRDRAVVNPRKGCCVLNPSGDLSGTESRFKGWAQDMKKTGWQTFVGEKPTERQFLDGLREQDLFVYFGHGGGEQYVRSHKIRSLPRCAAVMLWGCSSGVLKDMGEFDRVGTPYHYMLSGCPSLVANLWDVTDRDLDKFSQAVFDKLNLNEKGARAWDAAKPRANEVSLVAAVAQSRDVCKLKYLTGAAPVVYGIPFYL